MCKIFILVFSFFMFACEPPNRTSPKVNSSTRLEYCAVENKNRGPFDDGAEMDIKENMSPSDEPLIFLLFKKNPQL